MFPWFDLCAIGYQPYANLARLASESFGTACNQSFFRNPARLERLRLTLLLQLSNR